jgi:hypothetical protein
MAPSAIASPLGSEMAPGGVALEAEAHFGVTTAPFDVSNLSQAKGHAFVFHAAARYALSEPLTFELGAPLVLASVAQPAGSYVDTAALGNPQLGARYRFSRLARVSSTLSLAAGLRLGAPLASHGPDLMPNRALAIADGVEGRGSPEWFTPGVVPWTASCDGRWAFRRWSFDAELSLPVLLRVSRADLPGETARTRPLGLASVLELQASYRLSRLLSLAAGLQLFFDIVSVQSHMADASSVQDFERLSLLVQLGQQSALAIDVRGAAAGELGGTTVAGGLRLQVGF